MRTLDTTKPMQHTDGTKFNLLSDKGPGKYPIVGYYEGFEGIDVATKEGLCDEGILQLVNSPEKDVLYVNIYPKPACSCLHTSREAADREALSTRIACIRVEFVEGQYDK
jgi:hypothetical protein